MTGRSQINGHQPLDADGQSPAQKNKTNTHQSKTKKTRIQEPELALVDLVASILDDAKAQEIVQIDIRGKSSLGDYLFVASGRSNRHVGAIADQLARAVREQGYGRPKIEGVPQCDWVLVDAGDVIVHLFRPEVREFYNIEKMWSADFAGKDQT